MAAQAPEHHTAHLMGSNAVLEANPQWNHQTNVSDRDRWDYMINCLTAGIKTYSERSIMKK